MYLSQEELSKKLIGKKIHRVFMDQEFLKFDTDHGYVSFTVEGDCCSHSYFYDFYGVKKLFNNGPVTDFKSIELKEGDFNWVDPNKEGDYECIQCYGYAITTINPKFGEQTSVFSFRNNSNGYYGGSLEYYGKIPVDIPEITDDVVEVK